MLTLIPSRSSFIEQDGCMQQLSFEQFIEIVKTDTPEEHMAKFRKVCATMPVTEETLEFHAVPTVCVQSELSGDYMEQLAFVQYNGLVVLEIDNLSPDILESAKECAAKMPQTLAAMVGADGQSVLIIVKAQYPDGGLPQTEHDAKSFHAAAYQTAITAYAGVLNLPVKIILPHLNLEYLRPFDPAPYYNKEASPFVLAQPSEMPKDKLEKARAKRHELLQRAGLETYFYTYDVLCAMEREALEGPVLVKDNQGLFVIVIVAEYAAEAEIPEEETTLFLMQRYRNNDEQTIRKTVRNAYAKVEKEGKEPTPMEAFIPKIQRQHMQVEEFIKRRYEVRYNEVQGITEYRKRQSVEFLFKELTTSHLNTITHEAGLEGLECTGAQISQYINSEATPKYNPIREFLDNLPVWDGQDRITELMQLVPTDNPYWIELGSRWFLSMVNHWLDPLQAHANSTAPILIGGQGLRKSTFCKNILPPELRAFYTDAIDFRTDIEAERFLSRFLLINIDEFDQLSPGQFAYIKHMFQKTQTAHRQLFREQISNHPRYASFIGTSNCYDILKDPTGNRRFLCVEVKDIIHTERPIDYPQLYAQAVALIHNGTRAYIDDADEAKIKQQNQQFEASSPLEELFFNHFAKPKEGEEGTWMRPIDMLAVLKQDPMANSKMLDARSLGRILTKHGFKAKRAKTGHHFYVVIQSQ